MADSILIIGESGKGKSRALINMDETSSYLINVANKPLPFPGAKKKFSKDKKNMEHIMDPVVIRDRIGQISSNPKASHIKVIIVDDVQYIMANEFVEKAMIKGYEKFTIMAKHIYDLISPQFLASLRDDLTVVFLSHSEDTGEKVKFKTIGKMLDEKITVEGLFTVVLSAEVKVENGKNKYFFLTQTDGRNTCKSPEGMFESMEIPNDLSYVITKMKEYYES